MASDPAFDLTPDAPQRREHVLHFGHYGNLPSLKATRYLASAFGLSRKQAHRITAEVVDAMAGWRSRFDEFEITAGDQDRIGRDIEWSIARFR